MAGRKELIRLDAVVESVIDHSAFHAKLANGHEIVAYIKGAGQAGRIGPGDFVSVDMSPYDMSVGRICT